MADRREEKLALERIERELSPEGAARRAFLGTTAAAAAAAAATTVLPKVAQAATAKSLAAAPPAGFSPFAAPGKVVKVTKADTLQNNKLYPKPDVAKDMLTKALTELTGKPDLVNA